MKHEGVKTSLRHYVYIPRNAVGAYKTKLTVYKEMCLGPISTLAKSSPLQTCKR